MDDTTLIRFDRFMRQALYDPDRGYYTRHIQRVGWGGDFSTSATLGRELGRAIARWCVQAREDLRLGRRWDLIELGGGGGELAAQVLDSLGWWRRRGLTYHVVDVSRPLRELQEKRLAGRPVQWHDTVQEALAACRDRRAILFANEFIDAFPCRVLELDRGCVRELWLEEVAPRDFRERLVPVDGDLDPSSWSALAREYPTKQRVEIQPTYREWFGAMSEHVDVAAFLAVDYGDTVDLLYHRRPHGTLRAYCQQMRFFGTDVYRNQGKQDLTVDVNFTDLQEWAVASGWRVAACESQAEFLERILGAPDGKTDADSFLRDELGAGHAFKVLDLRRGTS